MMEARELRIGNFVLFRYIKDISVVVIDNDRMIDILRSKEYFQELLDEASSNAFIYYMYNGKN